MCGPRGLTRRATWHGRVGDENFLVYSGRVGIGSPEIFDGPGGLDRKEKDTVFGRAGGGGTDLHGFGRIAKLFGGE